MAVEAMLYMALLIEDINDFIDLIRVGACKGDEFVILGHFIQEVLSMRPENMTLRLLCAMAEDFDDINDESGSFIN